MLDVIKKVSVGNGRDAVAMSFGFDDVELIRIHTSRDAYGIYWSVQAIELDQFVNAVNDVLFSYYEVEARASAYRVYVAFPDGSYEEFEQRLPIAPRREWNEARGSPSFIRVYSPAFDIATDISALGHGSEKRAPWELEGESSPSPYLIFGLLAPQPAEVSVATLAIELLALTGPQHDTLPSDWKAKLAEELMAPLSMFSTAGARR